MMLVVGCVVAGKVVDEEVQDRQIRLSMLVNMMPVVVGQVRDLG
jgi:hypothetical protein